MTNAIDHLRGHTFDCPQAADVAAYILSVVKAVPITEDDEPILHFPVNVPFYMQTLWKIAGEQEERAQLDPVLDQIKAYFLEQNDIWPDHHGISGLLDDCYASYCYINGLNAQWQQQTGAPLEDLGLEFPMQMVAFRIGDDGVQKIEAHVGVQVQQAPEEVDILTVGKYLIGGLLAWGAVKGLMGASQPSNSDKAMQLIENQIRHGW